MRVPKHRRWPGVKLGAAAVALSLLAGGTAWSTGTAEARVAQSVTASADSPVALPATGDAASETRQAEVTRKLRELEASYQGRIGAFAYDTGTGRFVGNRAHELFPSNSTFKAILCGAVLDKARTVDRGLMERRLFWTAEEANSAGHNPVTGREENIRNGLTVAELCHATITESDNPAANLLLKQIGGPAGMTSYYRSLGDPVGRLDRYEPELNEWQPGEKRDTIMPAFMAQSLRELTVGDALVPQDRRQLNDWLKAAVTGNARIRAGLPNWTVGDKTGTGGGKYANASDIAIAWPESGAPVIIAIYTDRDGTNPQIDNGVIAQTASILIQGLGRTP